MYAADGGSRGSMIEPAPCFGAEPAEGTPMRAFNETKTVRESCPSGRSLRRDARAMCELRAFAGRSCGPPTSNHVPTVHRPKLRPADVCDVESRPDSPPSEAAARRAIARISTRGEACGAPRHRAHFYSGRSLRSARIDRCGPPRAEASARRWLRHRPSRLGSPQGDVPIRNPV